MRLTLPLFLASPLFSLSFLRLARKSGLVALASLTLLSACSHQTTNSPVISPLASAPLAEEETPAEARFSRHSLEQLLTAEFAGIRNEAEKALALYSEQAHESHDPAVIERTLFVANYLGDSATVLDMARLLLEVNPDNIDIRRLLAFQLARAGKILDAFPHGEYLLLTGDDDYLQSLAAFAVESPTKEKQHLLSLYNNLQLKHPKNTGLLLGKALLLRQLDRADDSLSTTQKLLAIDKYNETGQLLQGQLLHSLGQPKKAQRALAKALKRQPDSKRIRTQYARFLTATNLDKSLQQMAILHQKFPEDSNIEFTLGLAFKASGQNEKAIATFEHLIATDNRSSDAHYQIGLIAETNKQPEEAVYRFRQVRDGKNLLPSALRTADILTSHNNLAAAREHLALLRGIYPALRESLFQMEAEILIEQKRLPEGYDLLTEALQEDPNNINLLYSRGIISAEQKDLAATERDLTAIISQNSQNAAALNALGYALTNLSDRHSEALELLQRAIIIDPESPAITDSLGWVYFHLGDYATAATYLQQAFIALPDGEVAAHLGEVLWQQGKKNQAEETWRRGLRLSPNNPVLLDTLQRIIPQRKDNLLPPPTAATP